MKANANERFTLRGAVVIYVAFLTTKFAVFGLVLTALPAFVPKLAKFGSYGIASFSSSLAALAVSGLLFQIVHRGRLIEDLRGIGCRSADVEFYHFGWLSGLGLGSILYASGIQSLGVGLVGANRYQLVGVLILAATTVIVDPAAEEFLHRGLLFTTFSNRFGLVVGVAIVMMIDLVLHGTVNQVNEVGLYGLIPVLTTTTALILRLKSGSIYPGLITHSIYNLCALASALR